MCVALFLRESRGLNTKQNIAIKHGTSDLHEFFTNTTHRELVLPKLNAFDAIILIFCRSVFVNGVKDGRDGLGSVFVWASGGFDMLDRHLHN